ncbi:MAG: hypothetical protein AB1491_07340 [Thermodesulfobacteriota bacterium]
MRETDHQEPLLIRQQDDFSQALAALGGLVQLRQVLRENSLTIGFANGYGVTLTPVAGEGDEEVLEMLVLRFSGAGVGNFRVAQYIPIPELNRGSYSEIIDLCQQIAALPPRKALAGRPLELVPESNAANLERQCSNLG